ncbi:hypothetical protein Ahy_B05g075085 [Arachis hypogaea]|uniref:Transposase MuDR plant domain-containing protein n=1 Tax=Arachis hypogaea TaxID=3818 RepID=A0A444Z0I9_ARAHY|nr:hypothetical protein Ahy_B05g075085 [Arachis hypogaea]
MSSIHRDKHGMHGAEEFEVGQWFQSKEEVVLMVKNYNIRRGVQYKVFESDQLKYHGKCVQFGNGCNWLIRVTIRQRKGYWEVRKYNGPHTCLATELFTDHRQLDYHVICASILSLVNSIAVHQPHAGLPPSINCSKSLRQPLTGNPSTGRPN